MPKVRKTFESIELDMTSGEFSDKLCDVFGVPKEFTFDRISGYDGLTRTAKCFVMFSRSLVEVTKEPGDTGPATPPPVVGPPAP